MQRQLIANWRQLFKEELLRGEFLLQPNLAAGIPSQLLSILKGYDQTPSAAPDLNIDVKSYDYDGNEYSDFGQSETQETVVAVIPLKGVMTKYGTYYSYGAVDIAQIITEAANMETVSGIVLDIDSGGGSTAAIPPLEQSILYAKSQGKVTIAHGDTACSAAYWIAALCDYIFANNTLNSTFGSIGVMIQFYSYQKYFEQLGIQYHEIYADQSGQKNKLFRDAEEGNYDPIKADLLNPLAVMFQNHVRTARTGKLKEATDGILSGRTYTGSTNVDIGLADQIGTLSEAIKLAANLSIAKDFINNY